VRYDVSKCVDDVAMLDLIDKLQNMDNAKMYFYDKNIFKQGLFEFEESVVEELIEGRSLLFADRKK